MVEGLASQVRPEPQVVLVLDPVEVDHILVLRILAEVRHEVGVDAYGVKAVDIELGPAAFESSRAVSPGNSQCIQPDVLAEKRLFRCGPLLRIPEVSVHQEVGRESVGSHDGRAVSVAVSVSGVAGTTTAAHDVSERWAEPGGRQRVVMKEPKRADET